MMMPRVAATEMAPMIATGAASNSSRNPFTAPKRTPAPGTAFLAYVLPPKFAHAGTWGSQQHTANGNEIAHFTERERSPIMSTKVAMEPAPIPGSRAEASLEPEKSKNLRSIIGTVIVVTVAALAALMFGLFHGIGWQERLVIVVGAAAIAGGATYTFQRFLKGPGKSSSGEEGEV
jgi:hypothetical protein